MEIRQKIITIHCAKEFQICRRRRRERGLKGSWKRDFLNLSKFFEKDYIFHFMEVILRRAGGGKWENENILVHSVVYITTTLSWNIVVFEVFFLLSSVYFQLSTCAMLKFYHIRPSILRRCEVRFIQSDFECSASSHNNHSKQHDDDLTDFTWFSSDYWWKLIPFGSLSYLSLRLENSQFLFLQSTVSWLLISISLFILTSQSAWIPSSQRERSGGTCRDGEGCGSLQRSFLLFCWMLNVNVNGMKCWGKLKLIVGSLSALSEDKGNDLREICVGLESFIFAAAEFCLSIESTISYDEAKITTNWIKIRI